MFEKIDPRSPTPIYAQIATRVRLAVASGELECDDGLPSVRALATQLRVNPATVVQAYRELEQEGIVQMRQGAGTFVVDVAGPPGAPTLFLLHGLVASTYLNWFPSFGPLSQRRIHYSTSVRSLILSLNGHPSVRRRCVSGISERRSRVPNISPLN